MRPTFLFHSLPFLPSFFSFRLFHYVHICLLVKGKPHDYKITEEKKYAKMDVRSGVQTKNTGNCFQRDRENDNLWRENQPQQQQKKPNSNQTISKKKQQTTHIRIRNNQNKNKNLENPKNKTKNTFSFFFTFFLFSRAARAKCAFS